MYRIIPSCPVPSRPALIDSKKGSLNKRKEKRESIKEEEKSKEKNINTELSYTQVYPRPDRVYRVYTHTHTHIHPYLSRGHARGDTIYKFEGGGWGWKGIRTGPKEGERLWMFVHKRRFLSSRGPPCAFPLALTLSPFPCLPRSLRYIYIYT